MNNTTSAEEVTSSYFLSLNDKMSWNVLSTLGGVWHAYLLFYCMSVWKCEKWPTGRQTKESVVKAWWWCKSEIKKQEHSFEAQAHWFQTLTRDPFWMFDTVPSQPVSTASSIA